MVNALPPLWAASRRLVLVLPAIVTVVAGIAAGPVAQASPVAHGAASSDPCGRVRYSVDGSIQHGKVIRHSYSCHTARRVLKVAVHRGVEFGEILPAPKGWSCQASQRAEEGDMPKEIVVCQHRKTLVYNGKFAFGIRYP